MGKQILLRRIFIFIAVFFLLVVVAGSHAQSACDRVLGEWYSPDKDGRFLIYKTQDKYFGKIIWLKEPKDENGKTKTDKENPDPAKRNLPMVGTVIFKDFKWSAEDQKWINGKVYDARTGSTWSCEMKLLSNYVLEVRGYLLFSWLGKSALFTKY